MKVIGSLAGGLLIVIIGYGGTMFLSGVFLLVAAVWAILSLPRQSLTSHQEVNPPLTTNAETA